MSSPHHYENSTQKKEIRSEMLTQFEAMLKRYPTAPVVSVFLLPGEQWAFEQELCCIAATYPHKTFLICCFENDGPTFRTSMAPIAHNNLRVRHGELTDNIHLVYVNDNFGASNVVLAKYFSHMPDLLLKAYECPRFIWADFCCWPSYDAIGTMTHNLRKGDVVYGTFSLNWERKPGAGVSPCLWEQSQENKNKGYGWHTDQFIASRAGSSAKNRGLKLRQFRRVEYTGDSGNKVPMLLTGFEIC